MTSFTDLETNNSGYNMSYLGVFTLLGVSAMFRALSGQSDQTQLLEYINNILIFCSCDRTFKWYKTLLKAAVVTLVSVKTCIKTMPAYLWGNTQTLCMTYVLLCHKMALSTTISPKYYIIEKTTQTWITNLICSELKQTVQCI